MAKNRIKGLTVEIGGDTTKLGDALDGVEKQSKALSSELGEINRLLKLDPKNTELLAQKQKILADAVATTSKKLDTLREAERQVQQQFERGEVSEEQVRALQREIIATEQKLDRYKKAAKETADEVAKLGSRSKETTKETEELKSAANDTAAKGLAVLEGAVTAVVGTLVAATEASRDYRAEMGKLDTAFTTNGHSSEAAKTTYKALQGVLGDTGQAVEAANHLALLTDNEKDLQIWTDTLTGVYATFGASLPIEGLAEAANETAKVGQVTGSLADALNWAGVSEDAFNESLAACNSEQERQQLILETLNGLYGDAGEKYRETNAEVIAANEANEAWAESTAELGAELEPVLTDVKSLGAELLTGLVPVVNALLNNLPAVGVALAGVTAAIIAFKVAQLAATAATEGLTLAQALLNVVMNANPIGVIILAITALVTAFMVLWENCDGFRQFWIDLWDGIKLAFEAVVEWLGQACASVGQFFVDAWEGIKQAWSAVGDWFGGIWTGIKDTFSSVSTWFEDTFSAAWSAVKNVFSATGEVFLNIGTGILDALKTVVNAIIEGLNLIIKLPFEGLNGILNTISGLSIAGVEPFKWLTWRAPVPQIPLLAKGGVLERGQVGLLEGDGAEAVVPLERNTGWIRRVADLFTDELDGMRLERSLHTNSGALSPAVEAVGDMSGKLDAILAAIKQGQILILDGKTLVGATAGKMDSALGQRRELTARGAL